MITNYKYFSNLFIPTPSRLLSRVNKIVSSQRSSKSFQGALLRFFFYARDSLIQIFSPVCKTAICNKSGFPTFVCGLFGERVVVCWHCLQIPRSRIFFFWVYQRQENFTAVLPCFRTHVEFIGCSILFWMFTKIFFFLMQNLLWYAQKCPPKKEQIILYVSKNMLKC